MPWSAVTPRPAPRQVTPTRASIKLLGEAWRHAKAIGAVDGGSALADAGISAQDEGVQDGTAGQVAPALLELLAQHRSWDRFVTSQEL